MKFGLYREQQDTMEWEELQKAECKWVHFLNVRWLFGLRVWLQGFGLRLAAPAVEIVETHTSPDGYWTLLQYGSSQGCTYTEENKADFLFKPLLTSSEVTS